MTQHYRTIRCPVEGGELTAAIWEPDSVPTGTILLIHGITASHMSWPLIAAAFPEYRVIAPDLRGRGASRELPAPFGMPQHAADMNALLAATDTASALVVGHSMGGFVAASLAAQYPERVSALILIDGGLPIPAPEGTSLEELPQVILGPAAERLSMTFADRESYQKFWRSHPAFADEFTDAVRDYVDYDLVGSEPYLHPASNLAAVSCDAVQLSGDEHYLSALQDLTVPVHFIRAPRGLLNQLPALYSPEQRNRWRSELPNVTFHEAANVNHYTITLTPRGADRVAGVMDELLTSRPREVRA
ncbi:pimeloyl-ACP methyl ester carboxylesterase [Rhodoglobus vestalii]|uniref:Pimeloyl-ACP methyl ester carboxylesterase n=1 Tax=Rhodoglobus vestalii TaxID=193384 RepID=A0A8H2K2P5_9MICO|nr:alpha/beta hydrolase [Rhodoglobus vestalii]TQO19005.1 pimeloyl-ACP methyl ester carboxylesterase [Rhodoglobus vestalii]